MMEEEQPSLDNISCGSYNSIPNEDEGGIFKHS